MEKTKRKGLSIKWVTAYFFVAAITVLTVVTAAVGYNFYENNVMANYKKYLTTVLDYAYTVTEEYGFGDMIVKREMPEEYEIMRSKLNKVKENSDIDYLYAIYFDDINNINSLTYAINAKTDEEIRNGSSYTYLGKPCEEGSFEEGVMIVLQDAVLNKKKDVGMIEGYSEGYGYMFNGYKVIFDSAGNSAGLICVEIDINNIRGDLYEYARNIAISAIVFAIIITSIMITGAEYFISIPIVKLTDSVKEFINSIGDQDAMDESVKKFKTIEIHSNNEIGELYAAVDKLETDMSAQYREIRRYSENLLKMQDNLIVLIADMVENRDSDTGDHIKKTASYVSLIIEGLKRKGYYADQLTPQYMEDVVKSAPLHDTGKIKISDSILNKPGKLTSEEFEIMKTHTTAGKKIIEKAMSSVEGDSYLKEARDMAAYHHERWDGKGYPEGLKEEEIPLSARIMAVADVFDALTSKRVYKPPFSKEEAFKLIREGKGTQFDPKCVEVFLEAEDEVAAILKKYKTD